MLPILQIGPLTLRTPGLALLAGLWFGLEVASRFGKQRGLPEDKLYNVGFNSLFVGILGARLGYVFSHMGVYSSIQPLQRALLSVVAPVPGTEIGLVGLVLGILTAAYLIRRWKLPALDVLDSFSPAVSVIVIAVGLSNLLGGDLYGVESNLPWAIPLWGASRHPTQIYLMLAGAASLVTIWRLEKAQQTLSAGILVQITALIIGCAILLIEPLRADSPVIFKTIRTWQIGALAMIVTALLGFAWQAPESLDTVESAS